MIKQNSLRNAHFGHEGSPVDPGEIIMNVPTAIQGAPIPQTTGRTPGTLYMDDPTLTTTIHIRH